MFLIVIYNLSILNYPRISSIKNLSRHNPRLCTLIGWKNLQVRLRAIWFAKIVAISNVTSPWIFKIGMCLGYGHRDDAIHVILLLDLLTEPSRFMIFTWIKLLTVTFPTPIEDYPLFQIIIFDDIHYLYYTGPFLQSLKKVTIKIILVLYFFINHICDIGHVNKSVN